MGAKAVELLIQGESNRVIAYREGGFLDYDIQEALSMRKSLDGYMYEVANRLAR